MSFCCYKKKKNHFLHLEYLQKSATYIRKFEFRILESYINPNFGFRNLKSVFFVFSDDPDLCRITASCTAARLDVREPPPVGQGYTLQTRRGLEWIRFQNKCNYFTFILSAKKGKTFLNMILSFVLIFTTRKPDFHN